MKKIILNIARENKLALLVIKYAERYARLVKFIIAGGSTTLLNLVLLFIFTDFFNIWYLLSSTMSLVICFFVSFTLQKFWTFGDKSMGQVKKQFVLYAFTFLTGVGLNSLFMYLMVDWLNFWYMLAQVISSDTIAVFNYISYRFFIFNQSENE